MRYLYILLLLIIPYITSAQTEVRFYTSMGNFTVEMYDTKTPITSGNFVSLVDSQFYDGVIFHRVIDNFMIQGGDPTGTGSGGPGYTIPDEFDSSLSNIQTTISMANAGPNTGGSQFFINLVNNTYLDFDKSPFTSKHPVFGITTNNFSVVQSIGAVPTDGSNRPLTDVVMDSLRVISYGPLHVEQSEVGIGVNIYPNPMNSESILAVDSKDAGQATISVVDLLGRVVATKVIQVKTGQQAIPLANIIDGSIEQGIYTVVMNKKRSKTTTKLVVLDLN